MPMPIRETAPWLTPRSLVGQVMQLYDCPQPRKPGGVIRGYDRHHALRTARMCAAVARRLGHSEERVERYQIACLLHDLGRAGLDQELFGKIWSWARANGIPTRPREWRAVHPSTPYGRETEAFLKHYAQDLVRRGVPLDSWTAEQVEMRLGYARRLARQLRAARPKLARLGVKWAPWMERIMLYYYYTEKLHGSARWGRELGQALVAGEQVEAYSNRQRGRDYYTRKKESLPEAFAYPDKLQGEDIPSPRGGPAGGDCCAPGAVSR